MPRSSLAAALVLLALSGCAAVGPDYRAPETAAPAQWQAVHDSGRRDAEVLARWWRQFDDPVLDGLIADALAANTDLATAQAKLREARARRDLAKAGLAPSVTLSGSASRSRSSAETGAGATHNLYSTGFDASWEPDVFGGARRGLEAAEADLQAGAEGLHDTRVSLVAEVASNYLELRSNEQRLAIAEASLAAQSELYDLTGWRQQAGLVSELDAAQALTSLEQTRAGLPGLRTAITEARHRLATLLGRAPAELDARLAATGVIPVAPNAVATGIPADTLRQRPDVRAAERRLAAQTARLGEAEAARYPSFRLTGSLGLDALALNRLFSGNAGSGSLLAGITAPIFDAGRIKSNIAVQDAVLEQSRLAYRSAVLAALEEVENALAGLANLGQQREQLSRAAASARETLAMARNRYAAGLADFQTVLDSQRTQLNLEDQLASATGACGNAQIRLYKALGGGWTPDDKETP
ncbi:MAG: efflux transporter outer membrane subunit [Gallionellaceae bacterium]|nr:efflux transporter outer membrane subunit [Gallionellaceae bacterium]